MPDEAQSRVHGVSDTAPLPPVYTRMQLDRTEAEPILPPAPPFPLVAGDPSDEPTAGAVADAVTAGPESAGKDWAVEPEAGAAGVANEDVAGHEEGAGAGDPWDAAPRETEFPVDSLFLPDDSEPQPWPAPADEAPAPFDVWGSALGRIDEVAEGLEELARRLRDDASTLLGTEFGDDQPLDRLLVDAIRRYLEGA